MAEALVVEAVQQLAWAAGFLGPPFGRLPCLRPQAVKGHLRVLPMPTLSAVLRQLRKVGLLMALANLGEPPADLSMTASDLPMETSDTLMAMESEVLARIVLRVVAVADLLEGVAGQLEARESQLAVRTGQPEARTSQLVAEADLPEASQLALPGLIVAALPPAVACISMRKYRMYAALAKALP